VQANLDKKQVEIKVLGPVNQRRSALSVVLDDLDEVHKRNPETNPKAMVPLPDEPHLAESYQHLLTLEERYGLDHQFDPRDAARSYTVQELLEAVRRERRREREDQSLDYSDEKIR
jgi:hypothetical protein